MTPSLASRSRAAVLLDGVTGCSRLGPWGSTARSPWSKRPRHGVRSSDRHHHQRLSGRSPRKHTERCPPRSGVSGKVVFDRSDCMVPVSPPQCHCAPARLPRRPRRPWPCARPPAPGAGRPACPYIRPPGIEDCAQALVGPHSVVEVRWAEGVASCDGAGVGAGEHRQHGALRPVGAVVWGVVIR